MTNWFVNNGDALTTGYWGVAPWKRATSYATGAIVRQRGGVITIGIAIDFTNQKFWAIDLTNNGQYGDNGTDNPGTNTGGVALSVTGALFPAFSFNNGAGVVTANFGASAFVGTLPTGFSSVNTAAGTTVTWNPSDINANVALSGSNLIATSTGVGGWYSGRATSSFTAGKIYYEVTVSWGASGTAYARSNLNNPDYSLGWANATMTTAQEVGSTVNGIGWQGSNFGIQYNNGTLNAMHNYGPVTPGNERCYINNGSTFTSGATQPAFPLGQSATVADGTGTWTECTGQAARGWNAPWSRWDNMFSQRASPGDNVFIGDNNTVSVGGITTLNLGSGGNGSAPINYLSVDHTVASPGAGNLLAGATTYYINASATFNDIFYCNGMTFAQIGSGSGTLQLGNTYVQRFTNCAFTCASTNAGYTLLGNTSSNDTSQIYFEGVTVSTTNVTSAPLAPGGARFFMKGGSITTPSGVTAFRGISGSCTQDTWMDSVDMSGVGGATLYPSSTNVPQPSTFWLSRCKLPSAAFLHINPSALGYPEIQWYACDNGTDQESHGRSDPAGNQFDNKLVVRTSGATDSLNHFSEQATTVATIAQYFSPFRLLPMDVWNTTIGANRTLTIYGIAFQSTQPQTTDLWLAAKYLGSASSLLGSEATTKPANSLTAGANYAADTSAWDSNVPLRQNSHAYNVGDVIKTASNPGRVFFCTLAGTNAASEPPAYASAVDGTLVTTDGAPDFQTGWRFTMQVIMSSPQPQLVGLITMQIDIAKPSTTIMIDPLPVLS